MARYICKNAPVLGRYHLGRQQTIFHGDNAGTPVITVDDGGHPAIAARKSGSKQSHFQAAFE